MKNTDKNLGAFIRELFKCVNKRRKERWKDNHWLHNSCEAEDPFSAEVSRVPMVMAILWRRDPFSLEEENQSFMKQNKIMLKQTTDNFSSTKDAVPSVTVLDYVITGKDDLNFVVGVCGYLDASNHDPITFNMGRGQCSH